MDIVRLKRLLEYKWNDNPYCKDCGRQILGKRVSKRYQGLRILGRIWFESNTDAILLCIRCYKVRSRSPMTSGDPSPSV